MPSIAAHTATPDEQRDLGWLRSALQMALALEQATLPLYLAAMFSLRVQSYTAYDVVRSVAMEEMAHMATVCNVLAAVGGSPSIADLDHGLPSRGLPGGAEPDLAARLAPLSRAQLETFMRIEVPSFLLPAGAAGEGCPTIGALYGAIAAAVEANADEVRAAMRRGGPANQVGDAIGVVTLPPGGDGDPAAVTAALAQIVAQGEGSPARTLRADPGSEGEASHYCRFAELRYGRRYEPPAGNVELTRATEDRFFTGYRIPFPDVVNTLAVPRDGYARALSRDPHGVAAEESLVRFDQSYTAVLAQLDAAWNGPAAGSWHALGSSVRAMNDLRVTALFDVSTRRVPDDVVAALAELYPDEVDDLARLTDLERPVYYGPRFRNLSRSAAGAAGVAAPG